MGVSSTSREAFNNIFPELGERQFQVFRAIKRIGPCSNTQIARYLNRPINTITPRTNELRKKLIVSLSHIGICSITKQKVKFWKTIWN